MNGDFDFEPMPGIPAPLPAGEVLLWQGTPDWRSLAIRAFHVRKVAIYCGVLLIFPVVSAAAHVGTLAAVGMALLTFGTVALAAVAILVLMAWGYARTTVYSITSRRVIMRAGIALPVTFNFPFATISSAGLKLHADGTGDIPLALTGNDRAAYLFLWPNARPWRLARPEPMLRSVPDAVRAAEILAGALAAAAGVPAQSIQSAVAKPALSAGRAQPLPTAA